jgi:hypothetical protein
LSNSACYSTEMLPKPILFLLGCCHLQPHVPPIQYQNDQKIYLATLNAHVGEVTFIGEEAGWIPNAVAKIIAAERGISYRNIDISEDVSEKIHHVIPGKECSTTM